MSNFKAAPTGIVLAPAQNQVIDFVDDAGTKIQISQQDVYQYICDRATPQEVVFFMELCRSQRLNPFKREAFLVKYGSNPASMITAEVVFERRANSHPSYTGMEYGVVYLDANGNICKREGTATYKAADEILIGGWARVHRNDRSDAYAEVSMDEYGKGQSVWKTMPGVMISKCAKATALRLAFPSDFQGMYISEEMGVAPNVTEVHAEVMPDMPTDATESQQEPISGPVYPSKEQVDEFNNIVGELAAVRDKEPGEVTLAVLKSKALANTGYVVGTDMTAEQMDVAIRLVQTWLSKAYQDEPTYEE